MWYLRATKSLKLPPDGGGYTYFISKNLFNFFLNSIYSFLSFDSSIINSIIFSSIRCSFPLNLFFEYFSISFIKPLPPFFLLKIFLISLELPIFLYSAISKSSNLYISSKPFSLYMSMEYWILKVDFYCIFLNIILYWDNHIFFILYDST